MVEGRYGLYCAGNELLAGIGVGKLGLRKNKKNIKNNVDGMSIAQYIGFLGVD